MIDPIHIVMSPDGSQFAFSLNVRPYWAPGATAWDGASFGLSEYVGIWTYDLALRKGPRRIARWSHDPKWSPGLVAWSEDGLFVEFRSGRKRKFERVDPRSGRRRAIRSLPAEALVGRRLGARSPQNREDADPEKGPVEESYGEFFLWDPIKREKSLLFALPLEHDGMPDMNAGMRLKCRAINLREDGLQDIWDTEVAPTSDGLTFRVVTFVKRPGTLARDYTLRLELEAPDLKAEAEGGFGSTLVALVDTLVALGVRGTSIPVFVPNSRIREVLDPFDRSQEFWGRTYSTSIISTLRPDSIAGDSAMRIGYRDGRMTMTWSSVEIPRAGIPLGAEVGRGTRSRQRMR